MFDYLNKHIDKVAHCWGGFFLCVNAAVIAGLVIPYWAAVLLGFVIAATIGRWKEQRDKDTGKGTPDKWDFWWTVIGSTWGVVVLFIK